MKHKHKFFVDVPDDMAAALEAAGFGEHPGYEGAFTRAQAVGAIANGTVIRKVNSDPNDNNPDDVQGVVLGSLGARISGLSGTFGFDAAVGIVYFIEWESTPKTASAVPASKVGELIS